MGGFYGIALIHQFQSHKTATFRRILLILAPVFLSGLWLSEHNNTMDLQSTSLSLQRHIIHAKSIKLPHFHVFSSACVKNRNHFCNFLKTISLAVCWSYLLILLAGDVELNPGPQSADISSSTESFNDYMNVSVFEKNFSLVHYNV